MTVSDIVMKALERARHVSGGGEKVAAAPVQDLRKEAMQVADALEYGAGRLVDDGTPAGALRRAEIEDYFKTANGPQQTVSPTGTQKDVPAAGARKILPTGLAKGDSPAESGAPTGQQKTIGQEPGGTKSAAAPGRTLLEILSGQNKVAAADSPTESTASQNTEAPPNKNENTNVNKALGSNEGPVNTTKHDAKLPTRARLKELFASASDTGPSSAAAKAAFPNAYAKGGMKVAESDDEPCGECKKVPCVCEKDDKGGKRGAEKKASTPYADIVKSANLFDKMASGDLGDEAKAFAEHINGLRL